MINLLIFLAGDSPSELITAAWVWKELWPWLSLIIIIILSGFTAFSKRKQLIHETETQRAVANEGLVKALKEELALEKADNEKSKAEALNYKRELDSVTSEYKTLAGINIKELMDFWAGMDKHLTDREIDKSNIRRLEGVIAYYETTQGKKPNAK